MNFKEIIFVISLFSLALCEKESTEYKLRETKYGKIKGYINNIKDVGKVERYLGVPYARPPIDQYRFEDAEDPLPWREDILSTITLPAACPQTGMDWRYIHRHQPNFTYESEDCLYLNIYVPINKSQSLLEVLIHIHGGSNEVGMGGMFHGDVLAIKGEIIVITFNYRLGALGFLTGSSSQFRGNYGMTDQIKAFLWVQENIHYFGGDRNKVTITGHSAGGCDVGLHILSPLSKGLFRYAVMESGSPLSFWCVSKNENGLKQVIDEFAKANDCYYEENMQQLKKCLRKIEYTDLTQHKFKVRLDRYVNPEQNI
ncbi:hypothetical protein LOTGIDRAFT_216480 [Lottia gigantea]|uniref:Carboxylic ester hydrolase n=1 Tax=Lottia gigantea TaxID=225164 RepID=V4AHH8_LOTGI|nr:hypothetical protein LOTGIDRAFT_216480 [Lottia gigantea]ESO92826.1 hypothetical protein LOTGIDRAFT_216480 [Lottia gigantea]